MQNVDGSIFHAFSDNNKNKSAMMALKSSPESFDQSNPNKRAIILRILVEGF